MLDHPHQMSDILYYEVLDIPLPELECLINLKIVFFHAFKEDHVSHSIRLPKASTIEDILTELKKKVELSHPNAEVRLFEVFHSKINKIFSPTERIDNTNDQDGTLCAEEIPEEEKNLGPKDLLITILLKKLTERYQVQTFGDPFILIIHEGETLGDVKIGIQEKLQVPDVEFAKFAVISLGQPMYLQHTDNVYSRFQGKDVNGAWEHYLGLEPSIFSRLQIFAEILLEPSIFSLPTRDD